MWSAYKGNAQFNKASILHSLNPLHWERKRGQVQTVSLARARNSWLPCAVEAGKVVVTRTYVEEILLCEPLRKAQAVVCAAMLTIGLQSSFYDSTAPRTSQEQTSCWQRHKQRTGVYRCRAKESRNTSLWPELSKGTTAKRENVTSASTRWHKHTSPRGLCNETQRHVNG